MRESFPRQVDKKSRGPQGDKKVILSCLTAMWETWDRSLGQEEPLEKDMATHSSTLVCKIRWTEEPVRLQSMGLQSRT